MATHSAWADWTLDDRGEPGLALRECLLAATAAPSVHNTQPWRFRLRPDGVDVLADFDRRLEVIDPRGREVLLSVGAALLNLRIAIGAHGRTPLTTVTPPDQDPSVVARVTVGPAARPSATVRMLAAAIPRRHTNRRPFSAAKVPDYVLRELSTAAAVEGGRLHVTDTATRDAVLSLVRVAEARRRCDRRYLEELAEWTRHSPTRRDGVPRESFGPTSATQALPIRDFGVVTAARYRPSVVFEPDPTIAVLYSATDTPRAWVQAGQALERTLLTATVRGVATTLMTQPLEIRGLRSLLVDRPASLVPQAIVRIGYGPPCPPTPRRGLNEVLIAAREPVGARTGR